MQKYEGSLSLTRNANGDRVTISINNEEKEYEIYHLSVNPIKIVDHVLGVKNIRHIVLSENNKIICLKFKSEDLDLVKIAVEETLKIRCNNIKRTHKTIIREKSFETILKESDKLSVKRKAHTIYPSSHGGFNLKKDVSKEEDTLFL